MKLNIFRIALLVMLYLVNLTSQADSQIITPDSKFSLNVSCSRFRFTAAESYLEINYAIYPSFVTLVMDSAGVRGIIDLQTTIKKKATDSLIVNQLASFPVLLNDTSAASLQKSFVSKMTYSLEEGSYLLEVRAKDRLNDSRRDSIIIPIEIVNYNTNTALSDADLCSKIVVSTDKNSQFYKNSYEVMPNPGFVFGASISPVVFSYVELYNLKPGFVYQIITKVVDRNGTAVIEKSRKRQFSTASTVDVATLNVTSIPSGKYFFNLILADTLGQSISKTSRQVFIFNPKVEQKHAQGSSVKAAEFAGLSENELNDEFRKIRYIAGKGDINTFNKLVDAQGKREFLAKFWTGIESGERGFINYTRAIYLDRVSVADQRYRVMGKEGWFTDRGRVFVLNGEPDEVERFPSTENSKPYEIWQYYQVENGVKFIFIDQSGFGNYRLVHSTKRGEVYDEQWQEYLQ
jgi:GWxTD domain-containing protein